MYSVCMCGSVWHCGSVWRDEVMSYLSLFWFWWGSSNMAYHGVIYCKYCSTFIRVWGCLWCSMHITKIAAHRFGSCNGGNYNPLAGQLATRGQHYLWKDYDTLPLMDKLPIPATSAILEWKSEQQRAVSIIQRQSISMWGTHPTKPHWKELTFLT